MDEHTKSDNEAVSAEVTKDQTYVHCLEGFKLYSILSSIMIATILISLDVSIISTAIPAITSQSHAPTDVGWYGAAYPLTMCSLQPLSGKISTLYSLRWTYVGFFGIFLLGSLLCGVANSSIMFIIGRAIAGTGGAGVVSGGLSVIAMITPSTHRPLFTGLVTSLYAVGTVVAPIIGGALTNNVTWRWCFLINLPAGGITIIILLLFFHPPSTIATTGTQTMREKIRQLDLFGCIIFVPSIVMVFLALRWGGNEYSWNSAVVIGLFVGFAASMMIFILWELHKGEEAMIPFRLLQERSVVLSIIFAFLFMGSFVIPVYYLPEWFQIVKNASPIRSGIMLLPSISTQILGSIISGVLAKHVKYYNPWFFLGSTLLCIATSLYTTFTAFTTSTGSWIGFQILQGLGCGFAAQMALLTVQNILESRPKDIPVGISIVLFAQYFGSSVMQTIGNSLFQNKLTYSLDSYAHLNSTGVAILLEAGNLRMRETALQVFPDRLEAIITAYNDAVTTVFYLAVAGSALAFVLSFGIKWINTTQTTSNKATENQTASNKP